LSRFDSSAGDIRGKPRRKSLNRVVPLSNSLSSIIVQREHNMSDAIANGQNCRCPFSDMRLPRSIKSCLAIFLIARRG
jgi:hypothetical protein